MLRCLADCWALLGHSTRHADNGGGGVRVCVCVCVRQSLSVCLCAAASSCLAFSRCSFIIELNIGGYHDNFVKARNMLAQCGGAANVDTFLHIYWYTHIPAYARRLQGPMNTNKQLLLLLLQHKRYGAPGGRVRGPILRQGA